MFKKTSLLWSFEVVEFCLVFPAAVRHFEHSFQSYSTRGDTPSGRKNVLRKLLRISYRRLKAGFSVC